MTDYQAQVFGLLGGSLPWSFGFHLTGTVSEGALASAFTAAAGTLFLDGTNGLKNFMSTDVTVTKTTVATLNSTMHWTTATDTVLTAAGTNVNPSLPWSDAEVISSRSAFRTKSGHGRAYLPPFSSDQIASHVILAATGTKVRAGLNTFYAAITSTGVAFFVFNRKTLKDGTPPYTKKIINKLEFSDKPAHQRRRTSKIVPTYY